MADVLYWLFVGWWWWPLTRMFTVLLVALGVAVAVKIIAFTARSLPMSRSHTRFLRGNGSSEAALTEDTGGSPGWRTFEFSLDGTAHLEGGEDD